MLYAPNFQGGTTSVPAWTFRSSQGCNGCYSGVAAGTSFSARPSQSIGMGGGSPNGATSGLVNRGIGGAGLVLEAGKEYQVQAWIWSGGATTGFVELRDFTSGTSLAKQEFNIVSTGPGWGSTWSECVSGCSCIAEAST